MIENNAVIEGRKINNCTILSDDLESTLIGTDVILNDSIIGYGSQIKSVHSFIPLLPEIASVFRRCPESVILLLVITLQLPAAK